MARVLVIEDNADQRAIVRLWLASHGYEVSEAADGAQGLAEQRRRPSDVVVTDIFMPDKDGIETIHEIRAEFPQARIIAVSGAVSRTGADFLGVASTLGADRTLRKPFDLEELLGAVRELAPAS
jgi:CheY-like chemotaxis protein